VQLGVEVEGVGAVEVDVVVLRGDGCSACAVRTPLPESGGCPWGDRHRGYVPATPQRSRISGTREPHGDCRVPLGAAVAGLGLPPTTPTRRRAEALGADTCPETRTPLGRPRRALLVHGSSPVVALQPVVTVCMRAGSRSAVWAPQGGDGQMQVPRTQHVSGCRECGAGSVLGTPVATTGRATKKENHHDDSTDGQRRHCRRRP
jgi:hypothetical protein